MRRVQSSVYGVCPGAGATVVLQPAASLTECGRLSRRRSSLVFTPCPPETSTQSNSLIKIQRAASSFSSATGWDCCPLLEPCAGQDDVAHASHITVDRKSTTQHRFQPLQSTDGTEDLGSWDDDAENQFDESVSCFVSTSARTGCFAENPTCSSSSACYQSSISDSKSCAAAFHRPTDSCNGGGNDDDRAFGTPLSHADWLGAVLSDSAPRGILPPRSSSSVGGDMSDSPDLWQQPVQVATTLVSAIEVYGAVRTYYCCLRRVRRVVRDMHRLAEVDKMFEDCEDV